VGTIGGTAGAAASSSKQSATAIESHVGERARGIESQVGERARGIEAQVGERSSALTAQINQRASTLEAQLSSLHQKDAELGQLRATVAGFDTRLRALQRTQARLQALVERSNRRR
jgi:hypothetical protein